MSFRHRSGVVALAAAFAVLATGLTTDAAIPVVTVSQGASALRPAVSLEAPFDAVSVYMTGELTAPVRDAAIAAATEAGVPASVGRGFTALMTRVRRGAAVVQHSSGTGWAFPMGVTALPFEAVGPVMGRDVAAVLAQGRIVMGATTAALRGAKAGDVIDLVSSSGGTVSFVIGRVGTDEEVGGTEIVMSLQEANRLGATIATRVLIYGQLDRTKITAALARRGLTTNSKVRVRRSWDPPDPDGQLSLSQTKQIMGEFDFYYAGLTTSGWTPMNAAWKAKYIPTRDTYPTGIRAMCNVAIKADLRAALQEVVSTLPGLVGARTGIDVSNTNAAGGCAAGAVRFARITQALGSVSRHSWGQPIDMSTTANCQGCVPRMDCRIVRIFRKHGFAWGGNFLTPDGMHFEWVGEQRDTLKYPSKYCANVAVAARTQGLSPSSVTGTGAGTQRDSLFANDGLSDE
jgi:hypothetical protein